MSWYEAQRQWYGRNRPSLYCLNTEEVNHLKEIVSGKRPSTELSDRLKVPLEGFHVDYDRTCAAEMLLVRSLEEAIDPVIDWLKDLGEHQGKIHWTNGNTALACVSTLIENKPEYKVRFRNEAIPALKEIAMERDNKGKGLPTGAIYILGELGGEEAEKALMYVQENSPYNYSKWVAYRQLVEKFGHPRNEEMVAVSFIDGKPVEWAPRHKEGYGSRDAQNPFY
jgi:hypothetical protein